MSSLPAAILSALEELSSLSYENLSKIVACSEADAGGSGTGKSARTGGHGQRERSLLLSADWLAHSRATGAGGTCFSLTWWLALRLQAQGLAYGFLMGDKGQAKNIHCALRCDWEGRAYLLDPGYMLFEPLPLPEAGLVTSAFVSPNEVRIEDLPALSVWRLWSGPQGKVKPRFDYRRAAVSESEFLEHWEASFDLPMMGYPVLNRVRNGVQYYLQKRSLLIRAPEGGVPDPLAANGTAYGSAAGGAGNGGGMRKLDRTEMLEVLGVTFGIPEGLAKAALEIVTARTPDFFKR